MTKKLKILIKYTTLINLKKIKMKDFINSLESHGESKYGGYLLFEEMLIGTDIKEFLSIYPLKKEFNGDKYQSKDYFYSKKYIDTLLSSGVSTLNKDNIPEFFMETVFENYLFSYIMSHLMMCGISELYRQQGKPTPLDMLLNYNAFDNDKKCIPNYLKVCK